METDEHTQARARFEHAARAIEDDDLRLLVLLKDYDVTRLPPRPQRASHFLDCERNGAHALIEDLATATKGLARGTIPHVLLDELKYSNQEVLFRIDELFKDSGVSAAVIKAGNTETRFINFVKGVSGGDENITPEAYRLRIDNFVDKLKTDFREILAAIAAYERKRPSACDKDPPRPPKTKRKTAARKPHRGPHTDYMDRQLQTFRRFLAMNRFDGDRSKLNAFAKRCWIANREPWEKAVSAHGKNRGYSSSKALVRAYENS